MNSCIYEGTVVHARKQPKHTFRYRLFMMFVDLDELPQIFARRWFWSDQLPNLAWFRRKDFLGEPLTSLSESVRNLVQQRTGHRPAGPIRLLTNLRYFGFLINPISLYYCFDEHEQIEYVVAEVTNTPWGERHCYVLDVHDPESTTRTIWDKKALHVSPFMGMNYEYKFAVSEPQDDLQIRIENYDQGSRRELSSFFAALSMQRVPISGWSLSRVLLRYPLMTMQIACAIYWQALLLYLKGASFYSHPQKKSLTANAAKVNVIQDSEVCFEEMESTIQ